MTRLTITYTGPDALVGLLAQTLRREGVAVDHEPPEERRGGAGEVVQTVVISLICSGMYDAIRAGVDRFRASRLGGGADVDLPGEPPDEPD